MFWQRDTGGGDRARAHIARTGRTFGGDLAWRPEEDAIVRDRYPDYDRTVQALPHRSRRAVAHRAMRLGVAKKLHVWTAAEVVRLRGAISRNATNRELLALFPGLRLRQILAAAYRTRVRRRPRPPILVGVPILDAIRQKAYTTGLTLRELDYLARTGRYFQHAPRRIVWKHVGRALELFEAALEIAWPTHDRCR